MAPPRSGARWEGAVAQTLDEHDRRLDAINSSIEKTATTLNLLATQIATVATRVTVYAAVGGAIAGIAASIIVALIVRGTG